MTLQPFAGQNTQQIFKNCGSGKTLIRLIQKREGVRVNYKKEHHYLEKKDSAMYYLELLFCVAMSMLFFINPKHLLDQTDKKL